MALRALTPQEIGERVEEVRRRVGLGSVAMSLAMSRDKQFVSRWTTGRRKRIDRDELVSIANFAEGKGDFARVDARTILSYLDGDFDSWEVEIRPNRGLVDAASQPFAGTAYMIGDAKGAPEGAPEGAPVTPSPSSEGSEDQMSYSMDTYSRRTRLGVTAWLIPPDSAARELPPGKHKALARSRNP